MTLILKCLLLCLLILLSRNPVLAGDPLQLYDITTRKVVALENILYRLTTKRIVLVGEHHGDPTHHKAQLQIIKSIAETGLRIAVGLEMFRADSQDVLDLWIAGKMEDEDFQKAFYDNWGFSWTLYRDIFHYARDKKIPMVGLNVPRAITQQVARQGFKSLSPAQKGTLPFVECIVDPEYMEFVKRAHGSHTHGKMNFNYFCEAQLVWDKAMAARAHEFLNAHPGFMMIILAGTGHAWKKAIPEQMRQQSTSGYVVILPEVPGEIDAERVTLEDADYLFSNK
jgi:uncharacterized iron-regulated protein